MVRLHDPTLHEVGTASPEPPSCFRIFWWPVEQRVVSACEGALPAGGSKGYPKGPLGGRLEVDPTFASPPVVAERAMTSAKWAEPLVRRRIQLTECALLFYCDRGHSVPRINSSATISGVDR